ncbi:protein SPT2 homolog isoform X2 [Stegostoma tigrinum]|uniref:protein SPT2 homolog isoform X2 n=1 Tax=Stegostoma tigrinum TaxID=3053191 RepID=UPI00202B7CA5|nr:protein SPT2 homolog isoform X2 [Stegostoma tigrinum]
MDFSSIISRASENKVVPQLAKRYSLSVKPLKKNPRMKEVQSTAVQAFLKRKEEELKNKDLEERRRKAELLAKRVALKHDRKARAMATRTKDNFRGYDGTPVEQKSKKKTSDDELKDQRMDDCNEEDYYYEAAQGEDELSEIEDSEEFEEHFDERPVKRQHTEVPVKRLKRQHREPVVSTKEPKRLGKEPETFTKEPEQLCREAKKSKVPKKPPSAPMNFTDLLKLAEKKQFEPVELKPIKKVEEKLYTAEELKEIEFLERKRQKQNDKRKSEKEGTLSHLTNSSKKESSTKDSKNIKAVRDPGVKLNLFRESSSTSVHGVNKKPKTASSEKPSSSVSYKTPTRETSRSSVGVGHSISKNSSSNGGKLVLDSSAKSRNSSQTQSKGLKPGSNGTHSAVSSENNQKRTDQSTSARKNDSSSTKHERTGGSNTLHSKNTSGSASERSKSSSSVSQKRPTCSNQTRLSNLGQHKPSSVVSSGASRPSNMGGSDSIRPKNTSHSGPPKQSNTSNSGSVQSRGVSTSVRVTGSGLVKSGNSSVSISGQHPSTDTGRPGNRVGMPKPKCTVVSETISSKNFPSRPNNGQMNNIRSAPPGYRSLACPSAPARPPIPISYRRRLEDDDDEDDSEMDDFIDDSGESQDEISKHIKAIFGYDRTRYKDESDYALRYMESSWKEQQKEEAKSLQLGMMEDAEEMRKEEEELRRKMKAKKRRL